MRELLWFILVGPKCHHKHQQLLTSVLVRQRQRAITDTCGEGSVKTDRGGVVGPQAQECRQLLKAGKGKEMDSLDSFRRGCIQDQQFFVFNFNIIFI